jgi:class 3 adenylate cyclase
MSSTDERLLEGKMTELEQARPWSPRVISKFEALIRTGESLSLHRINPLAFARDRGIAETEAVDLFLHATRCGVLDMNWDVLCPQSGMVLDSFASLRTLKTHYVCGLCAVSGDTDLDDFIAVTFSVTPRLRLLSFHDPQSLSVEDLHWKLRFTEGAKLPGQQVEFRDFLQGFVRGVTYLPAHSTTTIRANLGPGALAGVNVQNQAAFMLPLREGPPEPCAPLRVVYDGERFVPDRTDLTIGPMVLEITHTGPVRGSLLLINWPPELVALPVKPPLEFEPYLSGGALLARQSFRRLFRSERVDENEGLGIRQITFVFTDLKGSTALYEQLGDLNAYSLVREHFALLTSVVQNHSGAVVKTIGDAVMAVFSRPSDAVAASLAMLAAIERSNRERGGPSIILKIGAHCGASIAVTLNDAIDYFGQTVNVAARVQSIAKAGEICLSEALYGAPGVVELLSGRRVETAAVDLRGLETEATIVRVLASP